jgi:hypothetical protein
MPGSNRRARAHALFAAVIFLWGSSCARGSHSAEGSPFGVAPPIVSSPASAADATVPAASYEASDEDATAVVKASPAEVAEVDAEVDASDESMDSDGEDDRAAPDADAVGPSTYAPSTATPAPGDLAITEVMLSPSGPEPASEWFEIYNLASSPRLLNGLTIQDGYGDTAVVTSAAAVVVPAATYGLFVRDQAAAVQTLVPAAAIVYAYGAGVAASAGIELDEGTAGDLSLWSNGTLLADVPYGMWDASWVGQSLELATPQSDATDPNKWCIAQSPWASGSDDGTPGATNDCGP